MKDLLIHPTTYKKLRHCINAPSHAYIFYGPKGLGKKSIAYHIGAKLTTGKDDAKTFKQITSFNNPNVTIISALDGRRGTIKIGQIKDLIEEVNLTPFNKKYHRVIIIKSADKMTPEAANSLLKSLEEPSSKIIFILLADNLSAVFPTIVSRTQLINFIPPAKNELKKFLKDKSKVDDKTLDLVIRLSSGKPGESIKLLEDKNLFKEKINLIAKADDFINDTITARFKSAKEISDKGLSLNFILELIRLYRDKILLNPKNSKNLDMLIESEKQLSNNLSPRLVLENLALNLH
ncbi:MAG: AAA family ATPase [bacterium]|nr:AAA family ATPase [bacterium]